MGAQGAFSQAKRRRDSNRRQHKGHVDAVSFNSRPHFMEDGSLAFIMRDADPFKHSVATACHFYVHRKRPRKRLFMTKVREQQNQELIKKIKRRKYTDDGEEPSFRFTSNWKRSCRSSEAADPEERIRMELSAVGATSPTSWGNTWQFVPVCPEVRRVFPSHGNLSPGRRPGKPAPDHIPQQCRPHRTRDRLGRRQASRGLEKENLCGFIFKSDSAQQRRGSAG